MLSPSLALVVSLFADCSLMRLAQDRQTDPRSTRAIAALVLCPATRLPPVKTSKSGRSTRRSADEVARASLSRRLTTIFVTGTTLSDEPPVRWRSTPRRDEAAGRVNRRQADQVTHRKAFRETLDKSASS